MRRLFRWVFRLLLCLVLLVGLTIVFRNLVARHVVERFFLEETGLETIVGKVKVRLTRSSIRIEDMRLMNPPDLGDQPFLDVASLEIRYDPLALLDHQFRIRRLELNLTEVLIVRNKDGENSVSVVRRHFNRRHAADESTPPRFTFEGVDKAEVTLGWFRFRDQSNPGLAQQIRIGRTYGDIQDLRNWHDLAKLVALLAQRHQIRLEPIGWKLRFPLPLPFSATNQIAPARTGATNTPR